MSKHGEFLRAQAERAERLSHTISSQEDSKRLIQLSAELRSQADWEEGKRNKDEQPR